MNKITASLHSDDVNHDAKFGARLAPKLSPKLTSMLLSKQPFRPSAKHQSNTAAHAHTANGATQNHRAHKHHAGHANHTAKQHSFEKTGKDSTLDKHAAIKQTSTTNNPNTTTSTPQSPQLNPNHSAKSAAAMESPVALAAVAPGKGGGEEGLKEHTHNLSSSTSSTGTTPNGRPISASESLTTKESFSGTNGGAPGVGNTGIMNVVILGGSFSGLSVAVTLAKNPPRDRTKITLIEPKSYLEVRWATIRSLFDDTVCDASTVPLSKVLSEHSEMITHIRAMAAHINLDTVSLQDGRQLPYDVLLIATGAITSFSPLTPHLTPGTVLPGHEALAKRRTFLRETGERILASRNVAVVGGGPVGTELAADIAAFAQQHGRETRVTLIDGNEKLMPGYPRSIAQKLREKLSSLHVRVVLGQHAVLVSPNGSGAKAVNGVGMNGGNEEGGEEYWELRSSSSNAGSGKRLDADFVLSATGVKPCASALFGEESSESTRDGWIRTDRFGRVIGCRGDVFAAGDCCDWSAKSGENTLANRNAYAHNLRLTVEAIANNRALASIDSRLKRVSVSHRPPAVVASTPRNGENASPFAALSPSWWWMKNRGMLLAKAQKEIGW